MKCTKQPWNKCKGSRKILVVENRTRTNKDTEKLTIVDVAKNNSEGPDSKERGNDKNYFLQKTQKSFCLANSWYVKAIFFFKGRY